MAAARTVWFPFHWGCHRSAVSLSALNASPLTQTIALMWGLDPCLSSPTSSPTNTLVFPLVPSSYWVLHGSIYSSPEKGMAHHSSTLTWKIPWKEEPGRPQPMGQEESHATELLHFPFSLSCAGEGNGNPLQCSCLENPRDSGAWWAAVYGVAQSQTRLKRLSSSSIYSSPLVRYSCPRSAGVLHALLCLKVYPWCIRGERCTPDPPTPPPSCSTSKFFKKLNRHLP